MKARIAKKSIKTLSEEEVLKAIEEGYDVARFAAERGVTIETMIGHFIKTFGRLKATKLFNGLVANQDGGAEGFAKTIDPENKTGLVDVVAKQKPVIESQTIMTIKVQSREDPSDSESTSLIIDGDKFSSMSREQKIDFIYSVMTDRMSDKLMQCFDSGSNDFSLSGIDKTFGEAVLSRVREQQLKRELQALFDKEDETLAKLELRLKNATAKRELALNELSLAKLSLHSSEHESSGLQSRIERCRENHEWHLPRRIGQLHTKAAQVLSGINSSSGKNKANQEKKYNSILGEIETCESEIEAAKAKQARLQADLDSLQFKIVEFQDEINAAEEKLKAIDVKIRKLQEEMEYYAKARFYLKMYDEGVALTTRNVANDLVTDDLRPITDAEIAGSIDWTDKLRNYEKATGAELSNNDFVVLVRILFLAPKQKKGFEIIYGEGTDYLGDVIESFLGRR